MSAATYGAQDVNTGDAPIQGVGVDEREGTRVGMKHELCLCVDAGTGIQKDVGDSVVQTDKAICCRMVVIQIFGDTDLHTRNTIQIQDFYSSANITSFMKKNIGDANPQLKKFKVLVDRTFTTSELSASSADRHIRMKFNQGTATLDNTTNNSVANKGSRIIWGMFFEEVSNGSATTASRYEAFPKYYGSYKLSWWDVKG